VKRSDHKQRLPATAPEEGELHARIRSAGYGVCTYKPRVKGRYEDDTVSILSDPETRIERRWCGDCWCRPLGWRLFRASTGRKQRKECGGLIKSDAAILRFLAAAEIIESDLGCSTRSSRVTRTMKSQLWPAADPRARLFRRALSFVPRKQTTPAMAAANFLKPAASSSHSPLHFSPSCKIWPQKPTPPVTATKLTNLADHHTKLSPPAQAHPIQRRAESLPFR